MLGERIFSSAQPFPLKLHRICLNVLPLVVRQIDQILLRSPLLINNLIVIEVNEVLM